MQVHERCETLSLASRTYDMGLPIDGENTSSSKHRCTSELCIADARYTYLIDCIYPSKSYERNTEPFLDVKLLWRQAKWVKHQAKTDTSQTIKLRSILLSVKTNKHSRDIFSRQFLGRSLFASPFWCSKYFKYNLQDLDSDLRYWH